MSSDSATTTPFQVAVAMPVANARRGRPTPGSPAQRVHLPGLGRTAGAAVPPGHDVQRGGGRAALRALDRLLRSGPCLADLLGPFLVDGLVSPAGAAKMSFGAASSLHDDGVPPGDEVFVVTLLRCASPRAESRSETPARARDATRSDASSAVQESE